MVCADLFMTPTAELADIVLPAAAWPELDQLAGFPTVAANVVVAQQKVVQVGECKPDEEIFVELARRMKLGLCEEPVRDVLNRQLKAGGVGMTFEELVKRGFYVMPMKYRKYEEKGFRTPTGKIELYSTRFEQMGYAPLPSYVEPPESPLATPEIAKEFPLVLTTGARIPFFFNSEHRQLPHVRKARREPRAEIHPDTAARHGIADGEWMWIETRRGRIRQRAQLHARHSIRKSCRQSTAGGFPKKPRPSTAYGNQTSTCSPTAGRPTTRRWGPINCGDCCAVWRASRLPSSDAHERAQRSR